MTHGGHLTEKIEILIESWVGIVNGFTQHDMVNYVWVETDIHCRCHEVRSRFEEICNSIWDAGEGGFLIVCFQLANEC